MPPERRSGNPPPPTAAARKRKRRPDFSDRRFHPPGEWDEAYAFTLQLAAVML
jgi:hypothetical protein